jgi:hypothetical protein
MRSRRKLAEGEMSVSELASSVFSIYSSHFVDFVVPFVFAGLVSGFFSYITFSLISLDQIIRYPNESGFLEWILRSFWRLMSSIFFLGLVSWVSYTIVGGISVKYTSDLIKTGHANLRISLTAAVDRLPSLIATSLITALLIGVGMALFIIPGITLAIMFSLAIPVVMLECQGVVESLARSRRLVAGRWSKAFVLFVTLAVILALIGFAVLSAIVSVAPYPLGTVLAGLVTSMFLPLYFISITVFYHDMNVRSKALTHVTTT